MSELSITPSPEPPNDSSASQRGRIIIVTGNESADHPLLQKQFADSTARPITVVENFYDAIGELTNTTLRGAPDAVIATIQAFGPRLREFSLALRKTDPAVTILAVTDDHLNDEATAELTNHVDALLTLPLNRLELERAILTADMAARQPVIDDDHDDNPENVPGPDPEPASPQPEPQAENGIEDNSNDAPDDALADTPVPAPPQPPPHRQAPPLADHDLLEQLLQSPEPTAVAAALELQLMSLYPELVDISITFQADAFNQPDATPILYQGQLLALLIAENLDPVERQAHADWVAPYLVMSQQITAYRDMAYTDDLTNAHNRRYFNLVLPQALAAARAQRECVTLLLFDIDNFKKFNDQFGHPAGDRILIETVNLLKSVIRPTDQVCRLGGDEFAVIFFDAQGSRTPGSSHPADITTIAQRFQAQIAQQRFPELGDKAPGKLTISGGLATFPWDAHDATTLYKFADQAALAAKRTGKNHITLGPTNS